MTITEFLLRLQRRCCSTSRSTSRASTYRALKYWLRGERGEFYWWDFTCSLKGDISCQSSGFCTARQMYAPNSYSSPWTKIKTYAFKLHRMYITSCLHEYKRRMMRSCKDSVRLRSAKYQFSPFLNIKMRGLALECVAKGYYYSHFTLGVCSLTANLSHHVS